MHAILLQFNMVVGYLLGHQVVLCFQNKKFKKI